MFNKQRLTGFKNKTPLILAILIIVMVVILGIKLGKPIIDEWKLKQQIDILVDEIAEEENAINEGIESISKYQPVYQKNSDFIGWIRINGTPINYPVMQTPDDENYYLHKGFDKKNNINGSLIMDTDSDVLKPSTNLIIHGHNMKNNQMFGSLSLYMNNDYLKEHRYVQFDTLYEEKEYEIIAVFLSQVFRKNENVFKYYKFFQANSPEEFEGFIRNIKSISLYDIEASASFGDELLTLSTCYYEVENGRLVVVAKRIKR